jgi:hypothetical protein
VSATFPIGGRRRPALAGPSKRDAFGRRETIRLGDDRARLGPAPGRPGVLRELRRTEQPSRHPSRLDRGGVERIVLTQPVGGPPGVVWAYASVPVDLLSLILENVTGQTLELMSRVMAAVT